VAGVDDAIVELEDVQRYLADPSIFDERGITPPKGILLSAPPGWGQLGHLAPSDDGGRFHDPQSTDVHHASMVEGVATATRPKPKPCQRLPGADAYHLCAEGLDWRFSGLVVWRGGAPMTHQTVDPAAEAGADDTPTTSADEAILDAWRRVGLEELSLPQRARTCFSRAKLTTVADLLTTAEADLIRLPNFGEKTLSQVRYILAAHGLRIGQVPKAAPGQILAATANGERSDRVTGPDTKLLAATPALDVARDRVSLYDWRGLIGSVAASRRDRNQQIVEELAPGAHEPRRTLHDVGRSIEGAPLTRERVRQIKASFGNDAVRWAPVVEAARRLVAVVVPACTLSVLVEAGFDPDAHETRLLGLVAIHLDMLPLSFNFTRGCTAGIEWVSATSTDLGVTEMVEDLLADAPGGAATIDAVRSAVTDRLTGRAAPAEIEALVADVLTGPLLRIEDDVVLDWSGSYAARARRVLHHVGEPMTTGALLAWFPEKQWRSVSNQLVAENGIIRVRHRELALSVWELEA